MPYVNIPETSLDASIAGQIGKIKGTFESRISTTLGEIENSFKEKCPSPDELVNIKNKIDSLRQLSVSIQDRLNRFRKITRPLDAGSTAILAAVPVLKALPIPGLALTAGATTTFSDILHLLKEFGTQLKTSSSTINSLLNQTSVIEGLIIKVSEVVSKVELALEYCQLCNESGEICNGNIFEKVNEGLTENQKRAIENLENSRDADFANQSEEFFTGPDGTVYKLKIIKISSTFDRAPLRQAVAELSNGKVVYRSGESFASSPDVLKNEVKFKINNSQV